jgi:hypothetical protein
MLPLRHSRIITEHPNMPIDILNAENILDKQAYFLKIERQAQHALAIVQLQLTLNQYSQGMLTGHELMNKVEGISTNVIKLRPGDRDLVNGEIVDEEAPESFLQRADASFHPEARVLAVETKDHELKIRELDAFPAPTAKTQAELEAIQCVPSHDPTKPPVLGDVEMLEKEKHKIASLGDDFIYTAGRAEGAGLGHWEDLYTQLLECGLNESTIKRIRTLIHSTTYVDIVNRFGVSLPLTATEPDPRLLAELQFSGQLQDGRTYVLKRGSHARVMQKPGFANFIADNGIEYTSLGVALSEDRELDVLYECVDDARVALAIQNQNAEHEAAVLESIAGNVADAQRRGLVVDGEEKPLPKLPKRRKSA